MFRDNISAIYVAKDHVNHTRTKHIDMQYHFIQEIIEDGDIQLLKIDTKNNLADMLTKNVPGIKQKHCMSLIHIRLVS